jgi:tight adherence protein C
MLPSILLDKAVNKRQSAVRNHFPDIIDQLIVCTEAGLGIEAGLQRVAKNIDISSSIMSYELNLIIAELRAGISRQEAFNNLVIRTGVEEIKGFVAALAQSVRFGTNIAATMRVYADDLRDKRMQRAEEAAAKIGVKMMFPLVFCFFPGIFVVILAPAVIIIMKNFL